MESFVNFISEWVNSQTDRLIFFVVALIVTLIISHYVAKAMHALLDRSPIPSATLFINVTRVAIWAVAFVIVLKPVFGIEANSLITALGIGGVAISLGMQDTISNIVSGFGLMAGRVVKPGDRISINGTSGVVKDVNWRHTVVIKRGGNEIWIPNSVLNTSSLEKLLRANEAYTTLPIVLKAHIDVRKAIADIVRTVEAATINYSLKGTTPTVRITSFTPYGIEANVVLYAKEKTVFPVIHDIAARALAGKPYLATGDAVAESAPPTAETLALNPLTNLHDELHADTDLVSTKILKPFADKDPEQTQNIQTVARSSSGANVRSKSSANAQANSQAKSSTNTHTRKSQSTTGKHNTGNTAQGDADNK
ncbi:mechanosensitive ion channel family protein [Alloscardovia criceti]|uniref:mechanosensitive ion channel family protein n=1 Tax=Alloscardovia criceti TaxID=356828 RepID=UPI00037640EA|nr:mechanosensitive ion channel family protein [Alloscardovia criceti]